MNNIKVSILGADGYVCQIPRIKEGMEALGHVLSEESPDLIYSNDPRGYEKALLLKKKYPKAYLILNFLDMPWHMPNIQKLVLEKCRYLPMTCHGFTQKHVVPLSKVCRNLNLTFAPNCQYLTQI